MSDWTLDAVKWMFEGAEQTDQAVASMLEFHAVEAGTADFLRVVQQLTKGKLLGGEAVTLRKQIEDFGLRSTTAFLFIRLAH